MEVRTLRDEIYPLNRFVSVFREIVTYRHNVVCRLCIGHMFSIHASVWRFQNVSAFHFENLK